MDRCKAHIIYNSIDCGPCRLIASGKVFVDMSDWIEGVSPLPCIIIGAKTGVVYSNQVGGCYDLNHQQLEGYIDEWTPLRAWYADHHQAAMAGAHPYPLIDMWSTGIYTPHEMRENLRASDFDMSLLDSEALAIQEWGEAWIPVKLPDGRRGVFTYSNSD